MPVKKWGIFILILLSLISIAIPDDLKLTKKVKGYEVEIIIDKNPPILGDNKIEITIKDAEGVPITDAKVLVNYYMPPMPRMAPMNYKTKADLKDDKFKAKMKLIMAGPWIIAVKITRGGKTSTAKFNVDAR
jgi:hypothetical protein